MSESPPFISAPPERRVSVKVKYSGRNRKTRNSMPNAQDADASDGSSGSEQPEVKAKLKPIKAPKKAASETSDAPDLNSSPGLGRKEYKRLDFKDLPGPSPRTKHGRSKDLSGPSPQHKRAGSMESLLLKKQGTPPIRSSASPRSVDSSRSEKPASLLGSRLILAQLASRADTPERDVGAAGQVATSSPKIRSCLRKSIGVSGGQGEAAADCADDDASSVAPSVTASESVSAINSNVGGIRRTWEERQLLLEQDPLVGELRPDEVFCEPCTKWIRLSGKTKYALGPWEKHVERVHGRVKDQPSKRVQEAEGKLTLVNDPQVGEFAPNWVICKTCKEKIQMSSKMSFDLTNWLAHKSTCVLSNTSETLATVALNTSPEPKDTNPLDVSVEPPMDVDLSAPYLRPPHSAFSTTSSDATVIGATPGGSPQSPLSKKREREDDLEDADGPSPRIRPRTESYTPPDAKPPGPWGWFWLPWETFKKGFAEGFLSSST